MSLQMNILSIVIMTLYNAECSSYPKASKTISTTQYFCRDRERERERERGGGGERVRERERESETERERKRARRRARRREREREREREKERKRQQLISYQIIASYKGLLHDAETFIQNNKAKTHILMITIVFNFLLLWHEISSAKL